MFTSLIAFILPIVLAIHVNQGCENKGNVDVYFGFFKEKQTELLALRILLFLAVSAVIAAIIGNFV